MDEAFGLRVPCDQQQNQLGNQKLRHHTRSVLLLGISLVLAHKTGAVKPLLLHVKFGSYSKVEEKANKALGLIQSVHMNLPYDPVSACF